MESERLTELKQEARLLEVRLEEKHAEVDAIWNEMDIVWGKIAEEERRLNPPQQKAPMIMVPEDVLVTNREKMDSLKKRVRELEHAANLATEYLAGSNEREALTVLNKVLAYPKG